MRLSENVRNLNRRNAYGVFDSHREIQSTSTDRRCRSLSGIIQSRHSRRAVPMKRSQCAFACGARTGVFNTCSDIDRRASSTAGAKMPSRSWTRKR